MIPLRTLGIAPAPSGSAIDEVCAALELLERRLDQAGLEMSHVLSLILFVDTSEADEYLRLKQEVVALVRATCAPEAPPSVSVVAQPPERGHVALEACVPACSVTDLVVLRKTCGGVPYTVVQQGEVHQVHAGGLASRAGCEDPDEQARTAFAHMEAILGQEGLTFGHVVRQWNYIESMLEHCPVDRRSRQRYQVFNDVRTLAYETSDFPHGYPAATGIGQAVGGVLLEFLALAPSPGVRVEPLSNPRQIDAHHYSTDVLVGQPARELKERTAPKFERAKLVRGPGAEVIFVSGTAAIVGQESVAQGDVIGQTKTTIELMDAFFDGDTPSYVRAYVKRAVDIPDVRQTCEAVYGEIPATFVQSDVCREELLVEMEAVLSRSLQG